MRNFRRLAFCLGVLVGCATQEEATPTQTQTQANDALAVSQADIADTHSGTYSWKVHVLFHRNIMEDVPTYDEWVHVRAENYAQAQFKAVDYMQYVHFYRHSDGGIWCMDEAIRTDLPAKEDSQNESTQESER